MQNRLWKLYSTSHADCRFPSYADRAAHHSRIETDSSKYSSSLNGVPWQMCLQSIRTAIDLPFGSIFLSKKY
jgi:hypothetical protein